MDPADPTLSADGGPRAHTGLTAGDVLDDRYELLAELGRGAHGIVFRAHDRTAGAEVAIKVLGRARRLSAIATERLRRELRAAWTVTHPCVVRIHDLVAADDQLALSMELVAGETLERHVERVGTLGVPALTALIADLASALAAAHAAGVTHRDLKPSNLMIRSATGRVVITDFGLSRIAGLSDPASGEVPDVVDTLDLTRTGELLGTPAFMAPEQLRGVRDIGPAADIYAVGLVMYEVATGERPHAGATIADLVRARLERPVPPLGSRRPDLPARLARVIDDCLAVELEHRIRDGAELARRLAAIALRPRWPWLAGAAVCAIAATGTVVVLAQRDARAPACGDGADHLAAITGSRDAIDRAFGVAGAAGDGARVTAALDRWATAWRAQYRTTCEDSRVRHDQSDAMLDRRMACLDRERDEVAALVALEGTADRATVPGLVTAATEVPSPARCADRAVMLTTVAPPTADQAVAVDRVRAQIRAIGAQIAAGQLAAGERAIPDVVAAALATKYQPVIAAAYHDRGVVEHGLGRPGALDSLEEAILAAEASHDDRAAAESSILVVEVHAYANRLDEARRAARRADAALRRLGGDPELEADLARGLGVIELHAGANDKAVEHFTRAIAIDDEHHDAASAAVDRNNLAGAYVNMGRLAESLALAKEVVAREEALLGPDHPTLASALATLATTQLQLGDADQAEATAERVKAIDVARFGAASDEVRAARLQLAVIHGKQHRSAAARAELEALIAELAPGSSLLPDARGNLVVVLGDLGDYASAERELRAIIAARAPGETDIANDLLNLSGILHLAGDDAGARTAARDALAALAATGAAEESTAGLALANLGDAERALGDLGHAEEHYRHARTILERDFPADHPALAYPIVGLGRILIARDDARAAVPLLERAVALRTGGDPLELAEAQLALARAAAMLGDRARSRGLGTAAVANYVAAGPRAARDRAEAEAWLVGR